MNLLQQRRDALQQHRRGIERWNFECVTTARRVNARAFLAFFLFFPEMGEARVLLESQLYDCAEATIRGDSSGL